ncbi:helix-turn-helix transcriptional regulator [Aliidiomarina iranensis]|nr:helix-turn-helix transcriptional regulator [Aliidiomarina iranensis]
MIVRKLRLKRGWSQSQLAEMAGVTTRTIQRRGNWGASFSELFSK